MGHIYGTPITSMEPDAINRNLINCLATLLDKRTSLLEDLKVIDNQLEECEAMLKAWREKYGIQ